MENTRDKRRTFKSAIFAVHVFQIRTIKTIIVFCTLVLMLYSACFVPFLVVPVNRHIHIHRWQLKIQYY